MHYEISRTVLLLIPLNWLILKVLLVTIVIFRFWQLRAMVSLSN